MPIGIFEATGIMVEHVFCYRFECGIKARKIFLELFTESRTCLPPQSNKRQRHRGKYVIFFRAVASIHGDKKTAHKYGQDEPKLVIGTDAASGWRESLFAIR